MSTKLPQNVMIRKKLDKSSLSTRKLRQYLQDAEILNYWRNNLVNACEDLLGIKLLDYQAMALQQTSIAKNAIWSMCRNAGKSALLAIYIMLIALLYPNQKIIIVGASGKQARNLFLYIERMAKGEIENFTTIKDVFYNEIKQGGVSAAFTHDKESYKCTLINGTTIATLNSSPDNVRSFRTDLLVYDEGAFISESLYTSTISFSLTDTSFKTSVDEAFDINIIPRMKPSQVIMASSQNDTTSVFYEQYRKAYIEMVAGNKDYYVVDVNIEVPLNPTIEGKSYSPLLDKSIPYNMLEINPRKALKEFWNKVEKDGGDTAITNSAVIHKCSTFFMPELNPVDGAKYIFGYDSAYSYDNSVFGVMKLSEDERLGLVGDVVNCIGFKDLSNIEGRQLMYPEQLDKIRRYILHYNGDNYEYDGIHKIAIDIGSGGNGISQCQNLLYDWKDRFGASHCGMIDLDYYGDKRYDFPNAKNIIAMREPKKWKNIMVQRTIDLLNLGAIRFPQEYRMNGFVDIINDDGSVVKKHLSKEETLALINIDLMKEELKMIHRYENADKTSVVYRTRSDMSTKVMDDRFYTLILMANELWMLRHNVEAGKHVRIKKRNKTVLKLFN